MIPNTHLAISPRLVGVVETLEEGLARASLQTLPEMAADAQGLVHGGFAFGLADYAAMLAVNHPNVVLGAASLKFLAPVRVGEKLLAEARVTAVAGKKRTVQVTVSTDKPVLEGELTAFVLPTHVLGESG